MDSLREIVEWSAQGPWWQVMLKLSGSLGVLMIVRQIYFLVHEEIEDLELLARIAFFLVTLAWIALFIATLWVAIMGWPSWDEAAYGA